MLNRLTCAKVKNGYRVPFLSGAIQLAWLETRRS
jgi:hypothetical protein